MLPTMYLILMIRREKKMNKPIKNLLLQKKGLTLIEVLMVMSLIGIVSLPLIQVLLSGQKQFVMHQNSLSEKSRCMVLQEKIKNEVLLAKSVRLLESNEDNMPITLEEGEMALYLEEGSYGYQLVKETSESEPVQELLSQDYLRMNELTLNFKLIRGFENDALEVSIKGADYQIDTAIQLINLKKGENLSKGQILIYKK